MPIETDAGHLSYGTAERDSDGLQMKITTFIHTFPRRTVHAFLCCFLAAGFGVAAYGDPVDPAEADVLYEDNKLDEAISVWLDVLSKNPGDRVTRQKLEKAYEKRQKTDIDLQRDLLYAQKAPAQKGTGKAPIAPRKGKILIYNFTASGDQEKHGYYSYIIPQTISKNITAGGKYTVTRIMEKFAAGSGDVPLNKLMQSAAAENQADYLVTGNIDVSQEKLDIELKLYNAARGSAADIRASTGEVGALLKDAVDVLSAGIERELLEQSRQAEIRPSESPFRGIYNALSGFSFGAQGGYTFIIGPWRERFDNSYHARAFLQYRFIRYFGIAINMDYLSTGGITHLYQYGYSQSADLYQLVPTAEMKVFIPFTRFFGLSFSVGAGAAFTKIIYGNGNPFEHSVANRRSTDPHITSSMSADFTFRPVTISIGAIYRHTFIYGEQFQGVALFGGLSYGF